MLVHVRVQPWRMKILLGQVVGTKMKKTAKVRVERLVLDKYVMQYYPRRTTVFAHDAHEEAKVGDVVLVKALHLPRTKHVKYGLDRIIYSLGNVTDPISGQKCDGYSYWDENGDDSLSRNDLDDRQEAQEEVNDAQGLLTNDNSEGEQNISGNLDSERQLEETPV